MKKEGNKIMNNEDFLEEYDEDIEDCYELDDDELDEDYEMNNRWRYSNYEDKDIEDWDEDDHLAAWFDHMMEK